MPEGRVRPIGLAAGAGGAGPSAGRGRGRGREQPGLNDMQFSLSKVSKKGLFLTKQAIQARRDERRNRKQLFMEIDAQRLQRRRQETGKMRWFARPPRRTPPSPCRPAAHRRQ